MLTGDGLLARLMPSAPIPLDAVIALCDASRTHGNGIVEVTQRGSLQIRGLSPATAPMFARTVAGLGLGTVGDPPIVTSPLLGLDVQEHGDLHALVAALRTELTGHAGIASISPKVSVLIDGHGSLHLDDLAADLRLRASSATRFHLSIAGNAAASTSLGWVEPYQAVKVIAHILTAIASRGTAARARDFANDADVRALRASFRDVLDDGPAPPPRSPAESIGTHRLNNGQVACGVALAFGYIDADTLQRFAQAAAHCGAGSIRPAPGRALLAIGLSATAAEELAGVAGAEGFVVRTDDPRRYVVACAGAPACGSAALATRQLAPDIARLAAPFLDGSATIHVSGCPKGCAHSGAAALTLAGPDRLIVQGRAGDTPHGTISAANFIAGLRRLRAERELPLAALVREADFISRLGAIPVQPVDGGLR
jgi:precorrin-3B synthase